MSLFDQLGGGAQTNAYNAQPNANAALQRLKEHPSEALKQAGFTIPAGMNDPQQMVQHLIQSGQIPQARLHQIMQRMMLRR